MKQEPNIVYRGQRNAPLPGKGIEARLPGSNTLSIAEHVLSIGHKKAQSGYISTSKRKGIARDWAGKKGVVVSIDLNKVPNRKTDISNGIVPGMSKLTRADQATVAERAVRNVEVVVEDKIPHSAIVGID